MGESRINIDELLKNKITEKGSLQIRKKLFRRLTPSCLIPLMPCVSQASQERVLSEERNYGRTSAICVFVDEVTSYNEWGYQFLDALHEAALHDLAVELYPDYVPPPNDGDSDDDGDNNGNNIGPHQQNIERSSPQPNQNGEVFSDPPPPYQERVAENDVKALNLSPNPGNQPPPPYSPPSQDGDRAKQNEKKKSEEESSSPVLHTVDSTLHPDLQLAADEKRQSAADNSNDLVLMISEPSKNEANEATNLSVEAHRNEADGAANPVDRMIGPLISVEAHKSEADGAANPVNGMIGILVPVEVHRNEAAGAINPAVSPRAASNDESDDFDQGHVLLSDSSGPSSPEAIENEQSADLIDFSGSVLKPNDDSGS